MAKHRLIWTIYRETERIRISVWCQLTTQPAMKKWTYYEEVRSHRKLIHSCLVHLHNNILISNLKTTSDDYAVEQNNKYTSFSPVDTFNKQADRFCPNFWLRVAEKKVINGWVLQVYGFYYQTQLTREIRACILCLTNWWVKWRTILDFVISIYCSLHSVFSILPNGAEIVGWVLVAT